MKKTFVSDIKDSVGQEVELKGWVYNFRSSGKIFFVQFRDGTGRVQTVYSAAELPEEQWNILNQLRFESSVIVRGIVKEELRAPSGFELQGTSFELIQLAPDDYPNRKERTWSRFSFRSSTFVVEIRTSMGDSTDSKYDYQRDIRLFE